MLKIKCHFSIVKVHFESLYWKFVVDLVTSYTIYYVLLYLVDNPLGMFQFIYCILPYVVGDHTE